MRKIYAWEPGFFMFFGLFHLHRIWGLIDRTSYADFWLGILESKGAFYFALMGILAFLFGRKIAEPKKSINSNCLFIPLWRITPCRDTAPAVSAMSETINTATRGRVALLHLIQAAKLMLPLM